jgi:hypothetical protein
MSVTPFGLGAVSYLVAGTIAGLLEGATVHSSRWLTSAIAMVSSVAGIVMFAVLGSVLGQPGMLGGHLLTIVTIVAVGSAVLVFPVLRTCRWADPEDERLRSAGLEGSCPLRPPTDGPVGRSPEPWTPPRRACA